MPGLQLPEATRLPPRELRRYAAVRLFAERATAVRPGFALDSGNAEAIALICVRLDGIPLAIELAAARARALSPDEILQRLPDRLGLLTSGARDAAARHQTLRAMIDWSHDLLERAERVLFRRLAVFAGGWTLGDAEQVCADEQLPRAAIIDVLSELVAKSLVIAEAAGPGATRYRMLEMLRDYALERLNAAGEDEPVARRHLRHFVAVAESAHERQLSDSSHDSLQTLAAQHDNIRAALTYARTADPATSLRLATASEQLWTAGPVAEGSRWLEEALANAPEPTRARVRALNSAAWLTALLEAYNRAGDHARQLVNESFAAAAALGDHAGEASARLVLGFIELACDHPATAIPHLQRSRVMHQRLEARLGLSRSLLFLGLAKSLTPNGGLPGRIELETGLQIAQQLGDGWGIAFGQTYVAFADLDAGDHERAAIGFRQGLEGEALGPIRAAALEGLAELALQHDPRRCIQLQAAAAAMRERDGTLPPAWRERRSKAIRAQANQRLDPAIAQQAWNKAAR